MSELFGLAGWTCVDMEMVGDPQWALRGLNERLRSFLDHVGHLHEANQQLERKILEWGRRNIPQPHDRVAQETTMQELHSQVTRLLVENARLALYTDSMKTEASRLQTRWEAEKRLTRSLEQQVVLLREKKRETYQANTLLETELSAAETDLQHMNDEYQASWEELLKQQKDVLAALSAERVDHKYGDYNHSNTQCDGYDPAPSSPNSAIHHSLDLELAQSSDTVNLTGAALSQDGGLAEQTQEQTALREAQEELVEVRKQWHKIQVEIESLHAQERGLQSTLHHNECQYSSQLHDLAQKAQRLETELGEVQQNLANQQQSHTHLLNTKMRLEQEIATYKKLLDCEEKKYHPCVDGGQKKMHQSGEEQDQGVYADPPGTEPNSTETRINRNYLSLKRPSSRVILTDPGEKNEGELTTVRTQEMLDGNVVQENTEGCGTVEMENVDKVIKQWEDAFFKVNPKLRKKSSALRFDVQMSKPEDGCGQMKDDSPPSVEVCLVMKHPHGMPTAAK
ncbi:keratin-like protein KRT222 [Chanos chanos]|uniref:Keratin-like protein KRT222 n=1 Tax=Chanos chanos TaxID=29144 RepID=A0A6J2V6U8_CHACN|nr:keratin-like protein KRT222 [Chanos chanos]